MADKLDLKGAAELIADLASRKLSDKKLKKQLLHESVEKEFSASRSESPEVTVSAKPGAAAAIELYNDAGDEDDDGVLGPAKDAGGDSKLKLPPLVDFDPKAAWLKYRIEAGLFASGTGSLEKLGFKFSVTKDSGLVLADYRRHKRSGKAAAAIGSDLAAPRVAFSTNSVMALDVGDALSMAVRGKLSAGVEISWSDVFSSQFGALSEILKTSEMIALKFNAGATATLDVELTADFRLVIARHSGTEWRVGLLRQKEESIAGSFSAGVKAEVADVEQLAKGVNEAIDGILDAKMATLRKYVDAGWDALKPNQRKVVEAVLERLGVPNPTEPVSQLEERLDTIQEKVTEKVKEIVETKVEAGFKYEYSRVSASAAMLMVRVPAAVMKKRHAELIRGSLDGVLLDAAAGKAFVETFMSQSSRKVTIAYGFTLGLGKWKVSGKDTDEFELVETKVAAKPGDTSPTRIRRAYKGQHKYEAQWIGESFKWSADFKVDMDEPSAGGVPRLDEFSYGLHLAFGREEKVSEDDLRAYVDHAVIWRVINPGESEEAFGKIAAAHNKEASVVVQVRLDSGLLVDVMKEVARADRALLGSAFAAALPWRSTEGRSDAWRRRDYYEDVWERFLLDDPNQIDAAAYAAITYEHLRDMGAPKELRWIEAKGLEQGPRRLYTVAGLIDLNSGTRRRVDQFLAGAGQFVDAYEAGARDSGPNSVQNLFRDLRELSVQSFHIRALGAHLMDIATMLGRLPETERTMTVSFGNTSIVIGS